ncbi:MAG: molybdopterin-dependent oxidoreductase [Proteobacteria bacterium]|nr:molybdopterin-dependent oxidoreductase [Pseudomonadota bacterium]MDA1063555.1 molybdopterin-dependent oxidoreductase [Pseudomonadota bacterium]
MGRLKTITRRTLLVGSAAIAGGVVFGYWRYKTPYENPLLESLGDGEAALTPYVRIDQAGITIIAPRAEMGQGVHTTLAALVAEELDVALEDVRVEHGPASKAYFNQVALEEGVPFAATNEGNFAEGVRNSTHVAAKLVGMQITGGSSSTPDAFVKMRKAGAAARAVLLAAAAEKLGVATDTLVTRGGVVIAADGTRIPYTELAVLAAAIEPPEDPELKDPADWKLLGRSLPRVDMVGKCTGTAQYSIDVRLPGMLFATVRMNPQLGGELLSFDAAAANAMPGVQKIVPLAGGVAVIASNTWYAMQAVKAIRCEWGEAPYPASSAAQFAVVEEAFANSHDSRYLDTGDVDGALADGADVEGEYQVPYLAHATMEPLNAVAWLHDGRLELCAGTQAPTQAVKDSAAIADLDTQQVTLHTTLMGGGFGRRAESDFIKTAVHAAIAMPGVPIKLTWSREEDTTHDTYRPLARARFRAKIANGAPLAFDLSVAAPSAIESQLARIGLSIPGPDISIVQAAWDQPYAIPNYRVTGYRAPVMTPISSWRSVGASQNGFFHESAIDEIAHAAGADPLQMRLALLTHKPSRAVLEAVATMSGWGDELPDGHGRGVAFVLSFGVPVAEVIEVAATANGIRILKAWAAVDVGIALDPRNIEAQVQSAINFGLSAAIMGEITLREGVVEQTNFHDYDAIRMAQAPAIDVKILENGTKIRGIGEPGLPPAAPALANAIFAATGQRIRELPLNKHIRFFR